jgi:predicted N-acyltransferase
MKYHCTLYDSVDAIDAGEWDSLHGEDGSPFSDRRYLRIVEKFGKDAQYCYPVFRDAEGKPVAGLFVGQGGWNLGLSAGGWRGKLIRLLVRMFPRLGRFPFLVVGLSDSFHRWLATDGPAVVLPHLDRLLCEMAAKGGARCISIEGIPEEKRPNIAGLEGMDYRLLAWRPMNYLKPAVHDFDEFCTSTKSARRRVINQSRRKFAAADLRVAHFTGREGAAQALTDDVHRLYQAVYQRAAHKVACYPAEFFRDLARQMPDETAVTLVYDGDRVVGFYFSLFSRRLYYLMQVGLDYEVNPRCDLYFNLTYHAVDRAYREGVSGEILLGETADDFKRQKLGCSQRAQYVYLKGTRPVISWFIRHRLQRFWPRVE